MGLQLNDFNYFKKHLYNIIGSGKLVHDIGNVHFCVKKYIESFELLKKISTKILKSSIFPKVHMQAKKNASLG